MRRMQGLAGGAAKLARTGRALYLARDFGLARLLREKAFCLTIILSCAQCSSSTAPPAAHDAEDLFGIRFRCNSPTSEAICLSSLQPECYLEVRRGEGLPQEPGDRLVLFHREKSIVVENPSAMIGCVTISSPKDALEHLRFFSSMKTVHMFRDEMLEIYESPGDRCHLVCLPADQWKSLGLAKPLVEEIAGGFRVTRFVIKPIPNYNEVTVFKVVQTVGHSGEVKEESAELVNIPSRELLYLGFPRYL